MRRIDWSRHRGGAPLLPPVLAYLVLTAGALVVPPLIAGERPWQSDHALIDFFQHHPGAAHASAFFTLGSAVPFAVAAMVATTRLRMLGLNVPGRFIAQAGGILGAAMLAVSGLATLTLTRPRVADDASIVRALDGFAVTTGGSGFVVFEGLLVAGVSISGWYGRALPRWLAAGGFVVAVISEFAALTALTDAANVLLPLARFGAMAWLAGIAVLLPAGRRGRRTGRDTAREPVPAARG